MSSAPPNLSGRIDALAPDERTDPDVLLEIFLDWAAARGLSLYDAQEEAILELMTGRHVLLKTPTGSGKSLVATAMHFRSLALGRRSFYTSPIKALVSEKFFNLCRVFSAENVGMMTGDSSINRDAPIICCTAEILANMALRQGVDAPVDDVVMDEFHYYSDRDRGSAWQIPLLVLERARFLLMSATLGDTEQVEASLERLTGQSVATVTSTVRPVPLEFSYSEKPLQETLEHLVQANRSPVYLVHFTQRSCAEQAQSLMSVNVCTRDEKKAIAAAIGEQRFDTPYGRDMAKYLKHGIGVHHGGLLPKYRLVVEQLAQRGLLKVICGTDTLGVGVNVPLRTVLFTKLCKFDGEQVRILSVRDFKQIAGRAGRKGFDDRGYVMCQAPEHVIENARMALKAASGTGKKQKFVRKKPPTRGYKHWDAATFEALQKNLPEPLTPIFDVDHGMIVQLMRSSTDAKGGGYRALNGLFERCHLHKGARRHLRRKARRHFKSLVDAGVLSVRPADGARGQVVEVADGLQEDFSLMHSLSLYLLDALSQLDARSSTYALDVVSIVEAILEHPRAILYRQVQCKKDAWVAAMKADGVPYEERVEKLESVTWDKPCEQFVYRTFNAFSAAHPWLELDNIRPKSVVRAMFEGFHSFNEYVRDLGLQRVEGVLLRYLTEAYKTLVQSVPESFRDEQFEDVVGYLRATLEQVDSSLVEAWERMRATETLPTEMSVDALAPRLDVRYMKSRIRAELHLLLKQLAKRDYDAAAYALRSDGEHAWDGPELEAIFERFEAEEGPLAFTHEARMSDKTTWRDEGEGRWRVTQTLVANEGPTLWALHGVVEQDHVTHALTPLLMLERVGI